MEARGDEAGAYGIAVASSNCCADDGTRRLLPTSCAFSAASRHLFSLFLDSRLGATLPAAVSHYIVYARHDGHVRHVTDFRLVWGWRPKLLLCYLLLRCFSDIEARHAAFRHEG